MIGCECDVCRSDDPRDNRLRTSAMIEIDGQTLVIDTGPDFRQQMLRAAPENVDAVLYTHEHKDHIAGMDDIRPFNFKTRTALNIYASEAVQTALRRDFHYVFSDHKYPGVPEVNLHTIDAHTPFSVNGIEVMPIQVYHYKMPVIGFRIGKMAYITDVKTIPESEFDKLRGLDVLVLGALRKEPHISHLHLEEALVLVDRLLPKRAYFTHISHLMGLHAEVEASLPAHVFLGHDQLVVDCV